MTAKPLTDQQDNVLSFVSSYREAHGYPPTLREIGDAIGLANINAVRGHLDALQKKGYISRAADKARSIQVLRAPSHLSRVKRKLHEVLRTDDGVLHRIVYGLAWMTRNRSPFLAGPRVERLRVAFEREAAERGMRFLDARIQPDHVVIVVEAWPNHSAQLVLQRLQAAGNKIKRHIADPSVGSSIWNQGYVATTDLELLDGLVAQFLQATERPG
jgi:REP element-mobilizing transposase RayT/DNA-binding MarR family transcriptional regulator